MCDDDREELRSWPGWSVFSGEEPNPTLNWPPAGIPEAAPRATVHVPAKDKDADADADAEDKDANNNDDDEEEEPVAGPAAKRPRISDVPECVVCLSAVPTTMVLPCMHAVACSSCSHQLARDRLNARRCVVCRAVITKVLYEDRPATTS